MCNCLFPWYILQIWRKFQKVGEEMVLLASSLSNMSQDEKQVRIHGAFLSFQCLLIIIDGFMLFLEGNDGA